MYHGHLLKSQSVGRSGWENIFDRVVGRGRWVRTRGWRKLCGLDILISGFAKAYVSGSYLSFEGWWS